MKVVIGKELGFYKAVADRPLGKYFILSKFKIENTIKYPTMHSVCITEKNHFELKEPEKYISHCCGISLNFNGPNLLLKFKKINEELYGIFLTIKSIKENDDLTFNYNTTELKMSNPFICMCKKCKNKNKIISGFVDLNYIEKLELISECSDHVKNFYKYNK